MPGAATHQAHEAAMLPQAQQPPYRAVCIIRRKTRGEKLQNLAYLKATPKILRTRYGQNTLAIFNRSPDVGAIGLLTGGENMGETASLTQSQDDQESDA